MLVFHKAAVEILRADRPLWAESVMLCLRWSASASSELKVGYRLCLPLVLPVSKASHLPQPRRSMACE